MKHISLIGMSGVGKSYWSQQLAQENYRIFCCDDMVEQHLKKILPKFKSAAAWMGQPYEKHYSSTSKEYLKMETLVIQEICHLLEEDIQTPTIVDTAGSLIYLPSDLIHRLGQQTFMVWLSHNSTHHHQMLEVLLRQSKPLIWEDHLFQQHPHESPREALQRCYPKLIDSRFPHYRRLAQFSLDYELLRQPHFGIKQFLEALELAKVEKDTSQFPND